MLERFAGVILSPDVIERFSKDRDFFLAYPLNPANCIVIDDQPEGIRGAKAAGMRAVHILRQAGQPSPLADHVLHGGLAGLLTYLNVVQSI